MKLLTLAFFILCASDVSVYGSGHDYDYESIEADQGELILQLDDINAQDTLLTDKDYFASSELQNQPEDLGEKDVHSLEKAEFYLTGILDAIDGDSLLDAIEGDSLLDAIDNDALLDDIDKEDALLTGINKEDSLDDAIDMDEILLGNDKEDYPLVVIDENAGDFQKLSSSENDTDSEVDELLEEAILEQQVIQESIANDYNVDYDFLSKLKTINNDDNASDEVGVDTSLDYSENIYDVVVEAHEVGKEELLIQVRQNGFSDFLEGIPEETKDFVYFENISTEMKAMEITLSLVIFMGSTVLLVGGILATMHVWRVVRPDEEEIHNRGIKTVKLAGIVKSYAKLPAELRAMKNPGFAYEELYEPV